MAIRDGVSFVVYRLRKTGAQIPPMGYKELWRRIAINSGYRKLSDEWGQPLKCLVIPNRRDICVGVVNRRDGDDTRFETSALMPEKE